MDRQREPNPMPALFCLSNTDEIASVVDMVSRVQGLQGPIYFRGLPDENYALVPSIARLENYSFAGRSIPVEDEERRKRKERYLFHRFRRQTYEHQGRILTDWEALFLARHHGLPVRLMDWTSNPLVALYWACTYETANKHPHANANGVVWWFKRRPETDARRDIDIFLHHDPFLIQGVRLIYPFYPTPRMTAQSGLFSIHGDPYYCADLKALPANNCRGNDFDIGEGHGWRVSATSKETILRALARLGVSFRTLFPELDGVPQGLIHSEVFRDHDYEYPSLKPTP